MEYLFRSVSFFILHVPLVDALSGTPCISTPILNCMAVENTNLAASLNGRIKKLE